MASLSWHHCFHAIGKETSVTYHQKDWKRTGIKDPTQVFNVKQVHPTHKMQNSSVYPGCNLISKIWLISKHVRYPHDSKRFIFSPKTSAVSHMITHVLTTISKMRVSDADVSQFELLSRSSTGNPAHWKPQLSIKLTVSSYVVDSIPQSSATHKITSLVLGTFAAATATATSTMTPRLLGFGLGVVLGFCSTTASSFARSFLAGWRHHPLVLEKFIHCYIRGIRSNTFVPKQPFKAIFPQVGRDWSIELASPGFKDTSCFRVVRFLPSRKCCSGWPWLGITSPKVNGSGSNRAHILFNRWRDNSATLFGSWAKNLVTFQWFHLWYFWFSMVTIILSLWWSPPSLWFTRIPALGDSDRANRARGKFLPPWQRVELEVGTSFTKSLVDVFFDLIKNWLWWPFFL